MRHEWLPMHHELLPMHHEWLPTRHEWPPMHHEWLPMRHEWAPTGHEWAPTGHELASTGHELASQTVCLLTKSLWRRYLIKCAGKNGVYFIDCVLFWLLSINKLEWLCHQTIIIRMSRLSVRFWF